MLEDEEAGQRQQTTPELTPEQARKKRAYHLALLRSYEEAEDTADTEQVDAADATMATFFLPGD